MVDLEEKTEKWTKEVDLILTLGDFNDCIFSQRSRIFFSGLRLIEFIINKHESESPGSTGANKKNQAIDGIRGLTGLTNK